MDLFAGEAQVPETEKERVRLAAREATPEVTLRALAQDGAVTVRAAVALNTAHAPGADLCLLRDPDERVRALLARRLASLLPGLSAAGREAAQAHVHSTLLVLADDAATRVRAAISDAVNAMPEAPRAVVLRLANDPVAEISDPVLRLSPLLTDADLLEILATPPHGGAATAIAGRAGLGGAVADRIALHADSPAVCTLLRNASAAIQESTLDALVGRAAEHPEWHEPLALRPALPLRAVRALSLVVAGRVMAMLAGRRELPAGVLEELRTRAEATLAEEGAEEGAGADGGVLEMDVRQLAAAGALSEASLLEAIAAGDHARALMVLAVASGTPMAALERAVALRSPKALVSLVWKAGFSSHAAAQVQAALGQLGPTEVLPPGGQEGFALTGDEMEWQIELLAEPGR